MELIGLEQQMQFLNVEVHIETFTQVFAPSTHLE